MKWLALIILAAFVGWVYLPTVRSARWWASTPTLQLTGQVENVRPNNQSKFFYIDIFIDSANQPLAAYEFELSTLTGDVQIVGIERGDDPNFSDPPYYDPAALNQNRIIIGAFNTTANLPVGKTRLARLHIRIAPGPAPTFAIKLIVAGSKDGKPIDAIVTFSEGAAK